MRQAIGGLMILAIIVLGFGTVQAESTLAEADALYEAGGLENYKAAIPLYEKAVAELGDNYEALWKCARAHRDYGNKLKQQGGADWEDLCAQHGKAGMGFAEKAIALAPDKVEGYYYYGLSVGIYSDGVSILTALSEGLKSKTQNSFETAYKIDKTYNRGGPMLSLGRFWTVLPWPMNDDDKALAYLREFQSAGYLEGSVEGQIYLAELLIDIGGQDNEAEARKLLETAVQSPEPYFADWAKRLLADLD
jgi:tetratricopeptide (TPR) repeat protein